MKYLYVYILTCLVLNLSSQVRFNINLTCGIDTVLDIGSKVIETHDGKFVSCGTYSHPFINYRAAYIVKADNLGNVLWKKQFNFSAPTTFSNNGTDMFRDVVELPDSNYLVLGITTNTVTNDDDVFLCKLDTAGNLLWFKKYMYPDDDESNSFKLTPDGKVIIVGYSFTTGYSDVLLIKTDLNGNLIWRKTFGNAFDEVYESIDIIKNNAEYILGGRYGYYSTGNPYYDFSVMRTDTAGNQLWQQQYGTSVDEPARGGTATLDSGYVLCGTYNGEGAIVKIDKHGIFQWYKNYGFTANSTVVQVKQLPDSNYVMIISTSDLTTLSFTGHLVKVDKNGNLLWNRIYSPFNTSAPNFFYGFNTTKDGGFVMTGEYGHIGQPYQNMWLVKTDSLGCDSVTCSYLVTGMEDLSYLNEVVGVSPNPSDGLLTINSESNFTKVELLSITGQVLFSESVNAKTHQLQLQNIAEGIYFMRVIYEDGTSFIKKVIKQ